MWVGEEGREYSQVPGEVKVWAGLCSVWRLQGRVLPAPRAYRCSLATSLQSPPPWSRGLLHLCLRSLSAALYFFLLILERDGNVSEKHQYRSSASCTVPTGIEPETWVP